MSLKMSIEWKILIVIGAFLIIVICAILFTIWQNPIWIAFLIASIITWALLGLSAFIFVFVPLIRFQAAPDLALKNYESSKKIRELELELERLKKE